MYKTKVDARTLETQLKAASGNEFCTYADVQAVTGLSYKQARGLLIKKLEPLPHTKLRRFLAHHAAQVIVGERG